MDVKVAMNDGSTVRKRVISLSGTADNLMTTEEFAPRTIRKWDREFDIVVVGSGAAGLAAAIEAADNDASVVVLEKMSVMGGNSMLSGGNYGSYGTDLQKEKGSRDPHFRDDSADLYCQEKRALGGYRSNPILARTFTDNSLAGYNWLKGLGMEYSAVDLYQQMVLHTGNNGGNAVDKSAVSFIAERSEAVLTKGRHHLDGRYKKFKDGSALMHCLRDTARAREIGLLTKMEVREIIREHDASGYVLGVRVKDRNSGRTQHVRARKAVILAAGGFSANTSMCIKCDQRIHPKIRSTGMKGVTGDVLLAAQDIGADTMNMDFVQIRMGKSAFGYHHTVMASKPGTYIDVDPQGRRFWKEMADNKTAVRSERLSRAHTKDMHLWYAIADSEGIKANRITEENIQKNLKRGKVFGAGSLRELARVIGVPAKNLVKTVERYNNFVVKRKDEDFGQHHTFLKGKIAVPPFFAMPKTYYIHVTLGGVRINETAQVIDRRGRIIPRLYAAGEITGGIHGLERNGGCGITECIVFGRIAGEKAAQEKRRR